MAKLTSTGVVFSDSTILNSKYGVIPQSSVSIFYQSSAPTGWTKQTTHNDKALRVVTGTGGGSGGSTAFSGVFPTSPTPVTSPNLPVSGTVGGHTLTTTQLPSHSHPNAGVTGLTLGGGDVSYASGWSRSFPETGTSGGGGSHAHPFSGSVNFSGSVDFRLAYIDVLLCYFT